MGLQLPMSPLRAMGKIAYASAGVVADAVIWHGAPFTSALYWSHSAAAIAREASVYGAFVDSLAGLLR